MTRGIRFVSEPPETPFAPVWDYSIAVKPIIINTENIAKIVLEKEKEIIEKYSGDDDGNTGLGADSLTARFKHFNVLKWQEVDIAQLHQEIRIFHDEYFAQVVGSEPPPLKVRCWANVMRKGQQIQKHTHSTHPHRCDPEPSFAPAPLATPLHHNTSSAYCQGKHRHPCPQRVSALTVP